MLFIEDYKELKKQIELEIYLLYRNDKYISGEKVNQIDEFVDFEFNNLEIYEIKKIICDNYMDDDKIIYDVDKVIDGIDKITRKFKQKKNFVIKNTETKDIKQIRIDYQTNLRDYIRENVLEPYKCLCAKSVIKTYDCANEYNEKDML